MSYFKRFFSSFFPVSVLCVKYQLWQTLALSKDDEQETESEKRRTRRIEHKKSLKEKSAILKEKYNLGRKNPA